MITLPKINRISITQSEINNVIEKVEDKLNIIMSAIEAHRKIFVNIDKRIEALEKKIDQSDFNEDVKDGAFKSIEQ